jgi:hypothetical protein
MSALMALCILAAGADAQVSDKIGKITTGTAEPGKILSFQVELLQACLPPVRRSGILSYRDVTDR